MSEPSKNIPKFSSFRPKAPPAHQQHPSSTKPKRQRSPETHQSSIKRQRSPDDQQTSSHRHSSSRRHETKEFASKHRGTSRHGLTKSARVSGSSAREPSPTYHAGDSDLYISDTKGDPQNIAYQRLHKYSIPSFHRVGYGNILGLDLRLKIDRSESTDDKMFIIDNFARDRDRPRRALLKRQKLHELPVLRAQENDALDLAEDFVALAPAGYVQKLESSDDELASFKDIDRPQNVDEQTVKAHQTSISLSEVDLRARQRNVKLFRDTKEDPTNIDAWIQIAQHQQYLVRPGADAQALTNSERRTLAELRITVYEKALKHFTDVSSSGHECLVLGLLDEASVAWSTEKYMQKVRDVLETHLASASIWTRYLDAHQTNPIDFRFEDVKTFFVRCIRTMATGKESNGNKDGKMMLYLILRYTAFLLDTGYDELSIAIWQALCEYHLSRPKHLVDCEDSHVMAEFEQFWESEAPRLGEIEANGWGADNGSARVSADRNLEIPNSATGLPFKAFSIRENYMSDELRLPGKTMDTAGADDPFHIVFFSDIKDVLAATAGGLGRRELLDALLCYSGLPPMSFDVGSVHTARRREDWRSDIFLHRGLMQRDHASKKGDNNPRVVHDQHYQMTTNLLFSSGFGQVPEVLKPMDRNMTGESVTDGLVVFVKRVLSTLARCSQDDDTFAEYYLAFELHYFPDEAHKVAKRLLKQRPWSPRLYNACALIESKLGRTEKASQIWSNALSMKNSFPPAAQDEFVLLWRNWIWCELDANQPKRALAHLVSFGSSTEHKGSDTTEISTLALLRIRKATKEGFENSITQSSLHLAALHVELSVLATYLTSSDMLRSSIAVIEDYCNAALQRCASGSLLIELLHQIKAELIAFHIRQKRSYNPSFVRSELELSITAFPNNTIFLEKYRENEARFRIDDRVRSVLRSSLLTNGQSPAVLWNFTIDQELFRYGSHSSGSTKESVRSTFARALLTTGSSMRHSTALWTRWLDFELQAAQNETTEKRSLHNLKDVFLSGLQNLPWSRDWVLRGLEVFDRDDGMGWTARDLRQLYNVLMERELRVRTEDFE